MNSKYWSFLTVSLFSIALSFLYCPPVDIFFDDREIFKYSGLLIKKGLVPYKDFFDHKPPMIFFLNFVGALLGAWGFWILDAVLVWLASLQFLKLNMRHQILFPAVLPVVFNFLLRNDTISYGIGMTREYTTILLLLACCIMLSNMKYKYFYLGLLTALIFFFQQEQVVVFAPFFIYSWLQDFRQDRKQSFLLLSSFIAGGLVITGAIVLYFLLNNALKEFWEYAFVFNRKWYTTEGDPGLVTEVITLKDYIYSLKFDLLFISAFLLGGISLFLGNRKRGLLIASLVAVILSFIAEFLSGKLALGTASTRYYLLPLAATLPFTLFVILAFTIKPVFKNTVHQLVYSALFLVNPFVHTVEYLFDSRPRTNKAVDESPEIKYLQQQALTDYQVYVFNHYAYIYTYNKFGVLAPSKWVYHFFWGWYPEWDKEYTIIRSIISDLKTHQTKYIIYDPGMSASWSDAHCQEWERFLYATYNRVPGLIVWERK